MREISEEEKQQMLNSQSEGKTEEKEETQTEEKTEENTEESKTEEKEEVKDDFDFNSFSGVLEKQFGKKFEKEDDIKAIFEKADRYGEVETTNKELSQKVDELGVIASKVNPLEHFANEDEYVRQQFLKSKGGELNSDALKVLSNLSPSKVKELSVIDALKNDLVINKGVTSEAAEAYLLKKYDVDDFNEIEDLATKTTIDIDGGEAKERLGHLYDGIDVPQKVDFAAAREQLQTSWSEPMQQLLDGVDKIHLTESVDFVVEDAMKEGLLNEAMNEVLTNGIQPSEEAGAAIIASFRGKILERNMGKVVESIEKDVAEKIKSDTRKEMHNDKDVKDTSRTTSGKMSTDDAIRSVM